MRHVFVDGLRSNTSLPPVAERGAAMAMGNSVKTWDAAYDTRFAGRMAQSAVDSYGTWRAALVLQSAPIVTTSVPAAGHSDPTPIALQSPVVTFPSIPVVGRSRPAPALHTPPTELRDAATHQQQPLADDCEDIVIDFTGDE